MAAVCDQEARGEARLKWKLEQYFKSVGDFFAHGITLFARTQPSESHSIENTSTNGSHFPTNSSSRNLSPSSSSNSVLSRSSTYRSGLLGKLHLQEHDDASQQPVAQEDHAHIVGAQTLGRVEQNWRLELATFSEGGMLHL